MKKAIIYLEVICDECGVVINGYYHNSKSISKLKEKTKGWGYIEDVGNLCPDCIEKMKKEKDCV